MYRCRMRVTKKKSKVSAAEIKGTAADFPKLRLSLRPPFPPMEARTAAQIPGSSKEAHYVYEPKWDGFRCIAFREGSNVALQSKAGQPLGRYFPELVDALLKVPAEKFVLDGEIVIEISGHLDFDSLLQRIHPAESRIKKLSRETPCHLQCFDILLDVDGSDLTHLPLVDRKKHLSTFFRKHVSNALKTDVRLATFTEDIEQAKEWMTTLGAYGCDGIVAKLANEPYHSGDREAMLKIKRLRTADCVIGGFRYATKKERGVGSLLLGLYNPAGLLDHIGFCSSFSAQERLDLLKKLAAHRGGEGFTGKAPGGISRWNRDGRSSEWERLDATLVCEVQYDHFSGGRFRHGTKFLRWRPEKKPQQCTFEQLKIAAPKRAA
jgi:ATP-dependent DNA ligase